MRMPSKDPRDYRTRGRWEGKRAPAWLRRRSKPPGAPKRYAMAGGGVGAALGAVIGAIVGGSPVDDAIVFGIIGMIAGRAAVDSWWTRYKRRKPGRASDPERPD
jgi:hypothetical protein